MIQLHDVKTLIENTGEKVLSLYLNVSPGLQENQSLNPAWRIYLKNALNDLENSLENEDKKQWASLLKRVDAFFADYHVASKALAVFFTPSEEHTFELPFLVEPQYAYGETLVTPLLWAMDEYERYLILMIDQEKAYIMTAYLGTADVEDTMRLELDNEDWREKPIMPRSYKGSDQVTHGTHVDEFADRIDVQIEHFYRDVIDNIKTLHQKEGFDRIILSGDEKSAHAIRRMMDQQLEKHVIDIVPMPMRTASHDVLAQILPTALEYEREFEMNLVNEVIDLAKSGNRGALGRDDVMEAMEQQRVELLIVPYSLADEELKAHLPVKALHSGSQLEMVHGEAAERLRQEGDLAARLYYAI